MTIRVAQVSTGNAGRLTLRQLIADDRFELVAVSTSNPEKVGKDAGELAGVDTVTGIAAVGDLDSLIAAGPECVVYCAMGDTRPVEATNDVRTLLEAGIDVVGSAPGTLQYPWGTMPQKVIDKVEASAQAGRASRVHHRRRSRVRQRPGAARPGQHLSAHRADHLLRAGRLCDVRRCRGDVRPDGLRQAGHRHPAALPARRPRPGLGHRDPDDGRRPRHRGRRDRRALGGGAGARELRHRRRTDRAGHHRGPEVLHQRHGRRTPGDRRRARHPHP